MLGTEDRPALHAKAKESHGLLQFVQSLMTEHLDRFRKLGDDQYRKAKFLKESSTAALALDQVFQSQQRTLTRSQLQKAFSSYVRCLAFYLKAGGHLVPKCHFMIHLIQRAQLKGNPRMYTTYRDESFNGLIAKIARSVHRRTWANSVHWKSHWLHQKNHQRVNHNSFVKAKKEDVKEDLE